MIKTSSNWLCKHVKCCRCHENIQEHEKYDLNSSSLNFKWLCKREGLEKRLNHKIFILYHSKLSYIQFVKAIWAWLCTISKDLQSIHSYTFKISKNHTQDSWITLAQQEPSCRSRKPPRTHTKLEKDQISMVAQPNLPQTTFSNLQTQVKSSKNWSKINLQQLQSEWSRKREFS